MKKELSQLARKLRKDGKSVKEIAIQLRVSPSSVSRWCSDIVLSSKQKMYLEKRRKEAGIKALQPWIAKNKAKKVSDIKVQSRLGKKDIRNMSNRDLFILGLGLYWGEGYKKGSQELGFTNSDPQIICVFIEWLHRTYGIAKDRLIARLTINIRYSKNAYKIQSHWMKVTGISEHQFTSPSFIKTAKDSVDKEDGTYRGTLRLKVRSGTSLRRRILASIEEASNQIT